MATFKLLYFCVDILIELGRLLSKKITYDLGHRIWYICSRIISVLV